jgi:hypothetical protein
VIKQGIFGLNSARIYRLNLKAADAGPMPIYSADRLAQLKKEYELAAKEPSNLRAVRRTSVTQCKVYPTTMPIVSKKSSISGWQSCN